MPEEHFETTKQKALERALARSFSHRGVDFTAAIWNRTSMSKRTIGRAHLDLRKCPGGGASLGEIVRIAEALANLFPSDRKSRVLPALIVAAALLEVRDELRRVGGAVDDVATNLFK